MGLIFRQQRNLMWHGCSDVPGVDMDELVILSITKCLKSPLPTVKNVTVIHVDVLES
jgi:hypothetical protein